MKNKTILKHLYDHNFHLGEFVSNTNVDNFNYIAGFWNNMSIININHIIASLKVFRKLLLNISHKNGKIILIGTLPYQWDLVKALATDLDQFYVNYKWVGGTLTNLSVRNRINNLETFYKNCNKQLRNRRDFLSFRRYELLFEGLSGLSGSPDLIIVFNLKENKAVVEEAAKANIPVLGFSCGSENSKGLTYKIPLNIKNESKLIFLCSFIKECLKSKNIKTLHKSKNWNLFFESFVWKFLLV